MTSLAQRIRDLVSSFRERLIDSSKPAGINEYTEVFIKQQKAMIALAEVCESLDQITAQYKSCDNHFRCTCASDSNERAKQALSKLEALCSQLEGNDGK